MSDKDEQRDAGGLAGFSRAARVRLGNYPSSGRALAAKLRSALGWVLYRCTGRWRWVGRYLLYLPREYGEDKDQRWPLILYLHGSGERGSDLNKLKANGPPKLVLEGREMPFIVVSPQCPARSTWDPKALVELLDQIVREYAVDADRIYLTGISMGGAGTWSLALAHPERFAAIAPIYGWGEPAKAHRLKSMPVWVFHGAKDNVVPLQSSQEMVDALEQVGNTARFTIHPDAGHDAWTVTYNNPAVFEWFLSHKR